MTPSTRAIKHRSSSPRFYQAARAAFESLDLAQAVRDCAAVLVWVGLLVLLASSVVGAIVILLGAAFGAVGFALIVCLMFG